MGSNSLFLYVGFPNERKKETTAELTKKYDYAFFQNELAASLGIQKDNSQAALAEVYTDYIMLMPEIAEVNAISKELQKNVTFQIFVLNLASHDSAGQEKDKEVAVKVTQDITNQVWIWSKAKFTNRKYLIEEQYLKFIDNPNCVDSIAKEDDPFWDPVEDIYLGCSHAWLHSLAYRMPLEEQISILSHSGIEEGNMQVLITPCTPDGVVQGDDVMILDPNELLGSRLDIMIQVQQCVGLRWIKHNSTRGILIKFKFYNERYGHQSRAVWHVVNPRVNFQKHITIDCVDNEFLNYLHTHAVVLEVWGLQGGRVSTPTLTLDDGVIRASSPAITLSPPSTATSVSSVELDTLERELDKARGQIRSLRSENESLVELCRVLKKENSILKTKGKESKKGKNGTASTNDIHVELGRALKKYFQDVGPVQRQLRDIIHSDFPPEPNRSRKGLVEGNSYDSLRKFTHSRQTEMEELSSNFNNSVKVLKESVAATVRARKNEKSSNGAT